MFLQSNMRKNLFYEENDKRIFFTKFQKQDKYLCSENDILFIVNDKELKQQNIVDFVKNVSNHEQCIFLCNEQMDKFHCNGFVKSVFINNNAFIDENNYKIVKTTKIYDAIHVTTPDPVNLNVFSEKVKNLALINKSKEPLDYSLWENATILEPKEEMWEYYNQSYCGLSLSFLGDGPNLTTSEYLLSGIPVVSPASTGGRHIWYHDHNSVTVELTEDKVNFGIKECIEKVKLNLFNSQVIRQKHINLANDIRNKFCKILAVVLNKPVIECQKILKDNFHKIKITELI